MKTTFLMLALALVAVSCASPDTQAPSPENWRSQLLIDVRTDAGFSINQFADSPVLVESFAVWCSSCIHQQQEIQKLRVQDPSVVTVSIDTDPNEDEEIVETHIAEHGFNWRYAVAPVPFTQSLLSEFGNAIVNAPISPIILVCDGTHARLLDNGVKDAEELSEEIAAGC